MIAYQARDQFWETLRGHTALMDEEAHNRYGKHIGTDVDVQSRHTLSLDPTWRKKRLQLAQVRAISPRSPIMFHLFHLGDAVGVTSAELPLS